MKDVAARAGVGLSTVSRVVSEKSGVSRSKRKAVERAIAELGYSRNDFRAHAAHGLGPHDRRRRHAHLRPVLRPARQHGRAECAGARPARAGGLGRR
ncbi:LacI family DNA-binding transcriptional regulator [Microbacterium sp. W4I4]|uniref:LacI family DNA-binding transcriptional regulator n=1 Tax=Microbacterium sp. W4I4 TaxID=3042295 RepID=UPI00358FE59E